MDSIILLSHQGAQGAIQVNLTKPDNDKYIIRFTDNQLRPLLKIRAAMNRRSMNAEILFLIEAGIKVAQKENAPETAISDALMQ